MAVKDGELGYYFCQLYLNQVRCQGITMGDRDGGMKYDKLPISFYALLKEFLILYVSFLFHVFFWDKSEGSGVDAIP